VSVISIVCLSPSGEQWRGEHVAAAAAAAEQLGGGKETYNE